MLTLTITKGSYEYSGTGEDLKAAFFELCGDSNKTPKTISELCSGILQDLEERMANEGYTKFDEESEEDLQLPGYTENYNNILSDAIYNICQMNNCGYSINDEEE